MGKIYSLDVRGTPVPTPRPRVMRGYAYIPKRAKDAQAAAGLAWRVMYGSIVLSGPVTVDLTFVFAPPKSWSKSKRNDALRGNIEPTGHNLGDIDNLIKTATDGLNGVAYNDDSQIVQITARKVYGEEPKTVIEIQKRET